jgi:PAT family acetyl-CoA transporter-like MFS transporter 1
MVSYLSTLQFVSMGSYFSQISDPAIGGTYMTLLNTFSNFGGTWPKYFVMTAVEYFTQAPCIGYPDLDCNSPKGVQKCKSAGGTCNLIQDGYYMVNMICCVIGLATFLLFVRPALARLQKLPKSAWLVSNLNANKSK